MLQFDNASSTEPAEIVCFYLTDTEERSAIEMLGGGDHQQTAKPGRKPEFNWELIETECHLLMDHHGYFDVSDPEWGCQARLEEALKKFCQDNWQREPAGSTLRQRLPEWISAWRWRKTGNA